MRKDVWIIHAMIYFTFRHDLLDWVLQGTQLRIVGYTVTDKDYFTVAP